MERGSNVMAEVEQTIHNVLRLIAALPTRERSIIAERYGLLDGRTRTLERVGKDRNLTRERVRQIERETMEQLVRGMKILNENDS